MLSQIFDITMGLETVIRPLTNLNGTSAVAIKLWFFGRIPGGVPWSGSKEQ